MSALNLYRGSGATALCGPAMLLVIRLEPADPLVASLWRCVLVGDLPGVLGILAASGLDRLADFGLSFTEPRVTRVLVRGSIRAHVRFAGDDRTETVSAEHVTAWHEALFIEELAGVTLGLDKDADGDALPLVAGVVVAASVERMLAHAVDIPPVTVLAHAVDTPLVTVTPRTTAEDKRPEPLPGKQTLTWSEPPETDGSVTTGASDAHSPVPKPAAPAPPQAPGIRRLKDRVAWLDDDSAPMAQAPQAQPAVPYGADRFGDTIRREPGGGRNGPAMVQQAVPRVRAVRCPAGHLNPPMSTRCRQCRLPVDEHQIPEEIEQPSLGVLRRDSTGESWQLSRAITVIGREPRAAGPSATLIHTANAGADVSRIHAEIRLDGWHVEVMDRSTHGTQIINPGHDPVRLEKNLPVRILPGAQLVLAGEVYLRYEVE